MPADEFNEQRGNNLLQPHLGIRHFGQLVVGVASHDMADNLVRRQHDPASRSALLVGGGPSVASRHELPTEGLTVSRPANIFKVS